MNKIHTQAAASNSRPEGRRLNLVPLDQRHGLGGKVIGVANAGPEVRVGISLTDCRYHVHALGPTGTGKTTLLMRMILDDVEAGRGVAAFDPAKGDLIRDLLARLPKSCGDRLVLIDPDERAAPPAINLLDPSVHGGSAHDVAANLTAVMAKVWSRWWGHRTADICYHGLLTLAHLEGATLAQLPRLLSDSAWRTARVNAVTSRLNAWEGNTLGEFWEGFNELPAAQRSGLVAPLLSRLRLVLAHPMANSLFGVPATTFSFADILDGGIMLARLPKGVIGEDGTRLVGSLLLAGLWQATTARARIPEDDRPDAMIVLDECHNFLHLPIGIDDALAEARGLHTSFVLAHQYLGQLSGDMVEAIDANARNKVYFALAPRDAIDQARHLRPYLDDGDLIRLGGFEVVLRPVAGGRVVPPVTADTEPPPPAVKGRAGELRRAAREHTGLAAEDRRRLLGETATAAAPAERSTPVEAVVELVGRNTFASHPEWSNETSNERSNEQPNDHEQPGEHAPSNTSYAHVDGGEEDPWTGTD
ncbi:type IV secretory system conjugative DNA transfer family protein [Micromonospora sp. WMMD1120]|uniref:type IV secretory system conjugative DNA transfer family protein n=1 Tax=Micromonospora sp. WMMD1120 TaxID=3016106 RepID=UPI002416DE83|nr:type IV secretory system conjugative DNA transfer family protein [Micromonospora sp. WMMD1120]MDG4807610.1 type IV secretory system conjugative DNA transfer family protein [Micromonospora sp. WMMD1120]